jgi:hypothetical protein
LREGIYGGSSAEAKQGEAEIKIDGAFLQRMLRDVVSYSGTDQQVILNAALIAAKEVLTKAGIANALEQIVMSVDEKGQRLLEHAVANDRPEDTASVAVQALIDFAKGTPFVEAMLKALSLNNINKTAVKNILFRAAYQNGLGVKPFLPSMAAVSVLKLFEDVVLYDGEDRPKLLEAAVNTTATAFSRDGSRSTFLREMISNYSESLNVLRPVIAAAHQHQVDYWSLLATQPLQDSLLKKILKADRDFFRKIVDYRVQSIIGNSKRDAVLVVKDLHDTAEDVWGCLPHVKNKNVVGPKAPQGRPDGEKKQKQPASSEEIQTVCASAGQLAESMLTLISTGRLEKQDWGVDYKRSAMGAEKKNILLYLAKSGSSLAKATIQKLKLENTRDPADLWDNLREPLFQAMGKIVGIEGINLDHLGLSSADESITRSNHRFGCFAVAFQWAFRSATHNQFSQSEDTILREDLTAFLKVANNSQLPRAQTAFASVCKNSRDDLADLRVE